MTHNLSKHIIQKALLATLLLSMLPTSPSFAGLYKWTDENGKTHYGDRPPPVNTRYGHEILSNSGLKVRTIDRELTEAERIEASRITQEMAMKMRRERELERIDRLLMVSFPNFKALDTARDDRVETLDDSIAYLQSRKDGLMEKRGANNARIQHFRRKQLDVPEQLSSEAANIDYAVSQLDLQIADIQEDRDATVEEFKQYSKRLRELMQMN